MKHRGAAVITNRDKIRALEQISAEHDSPGGGLRGLLEANARLIEAREREKAVE